MTKAKIVRLEPVNKGPPQGADGKQGKRPRKCMYRARAHSNPLSDSLRVKIPDTPGSIDWSEYFPSFFARQQQQQPQAGEGAAVAAPAAASGSEQAGPSASGRDMEVRFADIGCGFGGLLVRLATVYPETLMVGMELRDKVSNYVKDRIEALQAEHVATGAYSNIACIRTNAMRYLPHYFRKGQLTKMFFLFPDPHFKASNHRRRIINTQLITEYAYLLAPGGTLYTITDVEDLGQWMRSKLDGHPFFERISDAELASDPAAGLLDNATEEGQKVARNQGATWRAVYRRLATPRAVQPEQEEEEEEA